MTKKFSALLFAVMAVSILIPSYGQNVINCGFGLCLFQGPVECL